MTTVFISNTHASVISSCACTFIECLSFLSVPASLTYSSMRSAPDHTSISSSWSVCLNTSSLLITDFPHIKTSVSRSRTSTCLWMIQWSFLIGFVYTYIGMHDTPCKISHSMWIKVGQSGFVSWSYGKWSWIRLEFDFRWTRSKDVRSFLKGSQRRCKRMRG
jgi:hypothetical protein